MLFLMKLILSSGLKPCVVISNAANCGFMSLVCDAPSPGGPLTIRQPAETLVNDGRPYISHENRAESPLYGELYPYTNLSQTIQYNNI